MTIRTIRYDDAEWQVVPRQMTAEMLRTVFVLADDWTALLDAAPEPPAQQPMTDDTQRLDHLIQSGAFRVFSVDMGGKHTWTGIGRPIGRGPTVREAIDNSIQRHHGKGESTTKRNCPPPSWMFPGESDAG